MRQGTVKAGQGQLNRRWDVWMCLCMGVYGVGCMYVSCVSGGLSGVVRGAICAATGLERTRYDNR